MRQNVNDGSVDLGNALAPYARRARPLPPIGFKRGTDNLTLRHPVSAPLLSTYLRVAAQATDSSIALSPSASSMPVINCVAMTWYASCLLPTSCPVTWSASPGIEGSMAQSIAAPFLHSEAVLPCACWRNISRSQQSAQ